MNGVIEYNIGILTNRGTNIMDPDYYGYKGLKGRLGRNPVLSDFDAYAQRSYGQYLRTAEIYTLFESKRTDLYLKLNNGARRGSIARIVDFPSVSHSSYNSNISHGAEMTLEWDDGRKWTFAFYTNLANTHKDYHHILMVGYAGPTVYCFEKNKKVALPIPELKDNYGRPLEVGHWVMDATFKIGRISRISPKGTVWIDMLQQRAGKYIRNSSTIQFGKSTSELLRIDLPEGFEVTATIMDKDVTGLDIIPTFSYEARND